MKKIFLTATIALLGIWSVDAQQPLARPVAAVILDLASPPVEINLKIGQNMLILQNDNVHISIKDTDGKGELLRRQQNNHTKNAVYTATRSGTGELTIAFQVQAPGHKPPKPLTIKVSVTKLIPVPAVVPCLELLGGPLPKVILEKGQKLYFHITGLEEAEFRFSTSSKRLKDATAPTGTGVIKAFQAVDVGTAEIEIQVTTDVPGAKPRSVKISVEIKD